MRKLNAFVCVATAAVLALTALRSCNDAQPRDASPLYLPPRGASVGSRPPSPPQPRAQAPTTSVEPTDSESRQAAVGTPEPVVLEVRDRASGALVADARLLLQSDEVEPAWTGSGPWVAADPDGLVRLPADAAPRWALVVADAVPLQTRPIDHSGSAGHIVVVVDSGVALRGRLKTPSGTPAPNVPLLVYPTGIESRGTGLRFIKVWQASDGSPQWEPRDLQGRVARFRDGDPVVHTPCTDGAGEFRLTLPRADDWTVRMLDPGGAYNLATASIRPGDLSRVDFEFTIPDVCVARVHVTLPCDRPAAAPLELRLRRKDGMLALPFDLNLGCPVLTAPAVPFRLALSGITETVSDEFSPAAGETIDINLAMIEPEDCDTIELDGAEPGEDLRVVVVTAAGAVTPARAEASRDASRSATVLRVARIAEETRAIGVVATNTGRVALFSHFDASRKWRGTLGRTGGILFRWSDGARRGLTVTCSPAVRASYARFDEFWKPLDEQGTRGLAREMVLFGVPEGSVRIRIESAGQVAFDRDVCITAGKIESVMLDSPAGR